MVGILAEGIARQKAKETKGVGDIAGAGGRRLSRGRRHSRGRVQGMRELLCVT